MNQQQQDIEAKLNGLRLTFPGGPDQIYEKFIYARDVLNKGKEALANARVVEKRTKEATILLMQYRGVNSITYRTNFADDQGVVRPSDWRIDLVRADGFKRPSEDAVIQTWASSNILDQWSRAQDMETRENQAQAVYDATFKSQPTVTYKVKLEQRSYNVAAGNGMTWNSMGGGQM